MTKRVIPILLMLILMGTNAGITAALCARAPKLSSSSAPKDCKMGLANMPTPMSCCQHGSSSQSPIDTNKLSGCCQFSSSLPGQSNTTLPGTTSEEFKSHTQLQASDSDMFSLRSPSPVHFSSASRLIFRLVRSDAYLQSSPLRI